MRKLLTWLCALVGLASLPLTGHALVVGVYSNNATAETAAAAVATGLGHTATQLNDVAAASLVGLDVLWILNSSNSDYGLLGGNDAAIAAFVRGGGVLSFHDRRVEEAALHLPGGGAISFTRQIGAPGSTNIDVVNASTLVTNGPGGVINNASLDGGNESDHGYALLGTLPGGALAILSRADPTQIVDFTYAFGAGDVYYSTIPLDFYLSGAGNDPPATAMRTIYAVNELAFQASLAVPEPSVLLLLGLGFVGFGFARRRSV